MPAVLAPRVIDGEAVDPLRTTFFPSRETVIATERPGMALWRDRLFACPARNAMSATACFRSPPNRLAGRGGGSGIRAAAPLRGCRATRQF